MKGEQRRDMRSTRPVVLVVGKSESDSEGERDPVEPADGLRLGLDVCLLGREGTGRE